MTTALPSNGKVFKPEEPEVSYITFAISTIIIVSCIYLKIPQIMSIRRLGNANGVYLQAVLMEITGYTIVTLYNYTNHYSLMTYMEYPIILVQLYVLTVYIMKCRNKLSHPLFIFGTVFYIIIVTGFATKTFSKDILTYLLPLSTPISGFSKITYIYGIIKVRNADSVSLVTWIISIATNAGRIFTVCIDSSDTKLLVNLAISSFLSLMVFFTALYYKRHPAQEEEIPIIQEDHEHVD